MGGQGEGLGNFLCYGDFTTGGVFNDPKSFMVPRGAILNRNLGEILPVDLKDPDHVQEFVAHSWYDYTGGKDKGLHPFDGETTLHTIVRGHLPSG